MNFLFSTFNHCRQGQIIVEDITANLGHQLEALGHKVAWSNEGFIASEGGQNYNVVLESFADDVETMLRISHAHSIGCRFLCVATEEPTENGFNHGLEPAMIDRQRAFGPASRFFDGILHLIPGERVTAWYSQHAPSAHAELGFSPGLISTEPDVEEPDHDFGFFGKMTWRRGQILDRLEAMTGGRVLKIESLDVPRFLRDRIMRRARVIVQVRANEEWGMVSSTRCASALAFGRPVVAEPHPYSAPWDEVVHFSASVEEFVHDALVFARSDWRAAHEGQLARFKERLTPERCLGAALRKIGIAT